MIYYITPTRYFGGRMNSKLLSAITLTLGFVLVAAPVLAMGTPEDQGEDIFSLGEVVVSGPRSGMEGGETVHEITSEELRRSNARTLDEALALLSDVHVRVGNEGVPRVDIRGFRSRYVKFLLDGVPVNSSFDQQFDPSTIPVENIERIKVTAGASSVLYGEGGLGGVINIITKKGNTGLKGLVGFESGDGSPYLAKASIGGGKGKFDFFLSGSAFQRDNFPLAKPFTASIEEQAGYRKNSDSTRNNAYLNLGYTPNNDLHLALTGNFVEGGYGKPASAINNKFDPYAPPARFGRVDNFTGYTLQLAGEYNVSKAMSVRSAIYYNRMDQDNNQYDDENYNSFDNIFVPNSYKLRNTGINSGAYIQPVYDLGRAGLITTMFSGEWNTWIDSGLVKPGGDTTAQGGHGIGSGSAPYYLFPVSDHYDLFICSGAIEYEVSLLENLGFAAGYAHHWQFRDEKNLENYSVSVSMYYDLFSTTRLTGAFERNIQFPSLSQLYLRDSNNPNLTTETVYHYQLGVEQKLPWRSLFKIYGFRSDLHNVIVLDQNVNPAKNRNYSLYRFYGFETSLETNFLRNLHLKSGYTFNHSQDLSGVGRDEVQYVPEHKLSVYGYYDFDFGLTPFLSVIYVADSFVYSKQQIPTVMKHQMADYTVVNAKLSQKLFKNRLLLYVGVNNLFNKDYEDSYGIPRPGRYIFGGFEYRFSI
jgi:vitamin B12 transporter